MLKEVGAGVGIESGRFPTKQRTGLNEETTRDLILAWDVQFAQVFYVSVFYLAFFLFLFAHYSPGTV